VVLSPQIRHEIAKRSLLTRASAALLVGGVRGSILESIGGASGTKIAGSRLHVVGTYCVYLLALVSSHLN